MGAAVLILLHPYRAKSAETGSASVCGAGLPSPDALLLLRSGISRRKSVSTKHSAIMPAPIRNRSVIDDEKLVLTASASCCKSSGVCWPKCAAICWTLMLLPLPLALCPTFDNWLAETYGFSAAGIFACRLLVKELVSTAPSAVSPMVDPIERKKVSVEVTSPMRWID